MVDGGILFATTISNTGVLDLFDGAILADTLTNESTSGTLIGFGDILADVTNDGDATFIADTQVDGDYTNNGVSVIVDGLFVLGDLTASAASSLTAGQKVKVEGHFNAAINDSAQ